MPKFNFRTETPVEQLVHRIASDKLLLDDMDSHDMELAGDPYNQRFCASIITNTHTLYALVLDEQHEGRDEGI